MPDLFKEYEREFIELFINSSIMYTIASSLPHGETKKQVISELQPALDNADVLIQNMESEERSLKLNNAELGEYKSNLHKLKSEVKELALHNSTILAEWELVSGNTYADMLSVHDIPLVCWEVLKKLPLKTLVRFKSVSKWWESQINHKDFIKLHREFFYSRRERFAFLIEKGTNVENQSSEIILFSPNKPPKLICKGGYFDRKQPRLNCVEGLAILEDVVFNPATGYKLKLPSLGMETRHDSSFSCCFYFMGFSPSKLEYKVLCATAISNLLSSGSNVGKKTVYNIITSGESTWRPLSESLELNQLSRNLPRIIYCCVNGVLYIYPYRTRSIIAFDLAREVSKLIYLHEDCVVPSTMELHELENKVVYSIAIQIGFGC